MNWIECTRIEKENGVSERERAAAKYRKNKTTFKYTIFANVQTEQLNKSTVYYNGSSEIEG